MISRDAWDTGLHPRKEQIYKVAILLNHRDNPFDTAKPLSSIVEPDAGVLGSSACQLLNELKSLKNVSSLEMMLGNGSSWPDFGVVVFFEAQPSEETTTKAEELVYMIYELVLLNEKKIVLCDSLF